MAKRTDPLPRPAEELDALAAYYSTHDTSSEMEDGEWVDPRPMQTTSLRLPADVLDAVKALAQARGQRYTALIREIIEQVVSGQRLAESDEVVVRIDQRLARIEESVATKSQASDPQRKNRKTLAAQVRQQNLARRRAVRTAAAAARAQKINAKTTARTERRIGRS